MFALAMQLFIIMNPLGNAPLIVKLSKNVASHKRTSLIIQETLAAILLMALFYCCGDFILKALGIPQSATYIAGAILLGKVALKTLFPGTEDLSSSLGLKANERPFIVPIATPLLAGPGSFTTLMNIKPNEYNSFTVFGALGLLFFMTTTVLLLAPKIFSIFCDKTIMALEKIIGMFLLMMSISMGIKGIMLCY